MEDGVNSSPASAPAAAANGDEELSARVQHVSLDASEPVDLTDGAEAADGDISSLPSFLTVTSPGHVKRLSSWLASAEADAAAQMESPPIRKSRPPPIEREDSELGEMVDQLNPPAAARLSDVSTQSEVESSVSMTSSSISSSSISSSSNSASSNSASSMGSSSTGASSMRASFALFGEDCFAELVRTEAEYIADLKTMLTVYARPAHKLQILSSDEKAAIFGNTEQLLVMAEALHDEVRHRCASRSAQAHLCVTAARLDPPKHTPPGHARPILPATRVPCSPRRALAHPAL